ncbi:MAG: MaoC family dehydratase N-terminal domain-containing protein [Halioglobus sp.]|nr:MaoC family dehydratase N-terminal domain-containing protein [Halioglobus sp.]
MTIDSDANSGGARYEEFGTIPDYLSAANRERILELSQPNEKEISQVECSEYLIRHWLETVEDANPLYNDRDYARSRGFKDIIAQPGMNICTLVMPFRWPMMEFHKTRQLLHFEVKELLELPVGILANYEMFFYHPVEIGDRLSTTGRLVEISAFKRTRLGDGYFTKLETNYYNQRDELVSSAHTNLFSYGGKPGLGQVIEERATKAAAVAQEQAVFSTLEDQAPMDPPQGEWLKGGWHNGTEEMLESWRTGWQGGEPAKTSWREVAVGDQLPPLIMPITITRCVFMASASRDFAPQHHNTWYCHNKSRTREMFLGTHFNLGMLSRFMTDYGGPLSTVRRIQLQMKRTIGAGEDYRMSGVITRKWEEGDEKRVDMDITIDTELGPAYFCSATLALPE